MDDTLDVRAKLLGFWSKYEKGKMTAGEARIHIGFGRAVLESLKVEIAAAHLNSAQAPPVSLGKKVRLAVTSKAA